MSRAIAEVVAGHDLEDIRRLFLEYADWTGVDLGFQDFERELAGLPGDYVAPSGALLIARVAGVAAGCVAAHRWSADVCEMKRLFVREQYRGSGCGAALVRHVIEWALRAGYERIVLDTLPSMSKALLLYERLGFRDVPAYRFNPLPGARYLGLDLVGERRDHAL